MLRRYGADRSENSAIDRSAVEEELPTDLLDEFLSAALTGGALTLVVANCLAAPYLIGAHGWGEFWRFNGAG